MHDTSLNGNPDVSSLLSDPDALDALVEAGFDPEAAPASMRERCVGVARLLGVVDQPVPTPDPSLVDLTLLRVQRSRDECRLCDDDAEALDALLVAGYRPERTPAGLRSRAAQHAAVAELIRATGPSDRPSSELTDRTLGAVQAHIDSSQRAMAIEPRARRGRGMGLADVVSVAAMFLIAASLIWPVLSAGRSEQFRVACAQNLHASVIGLSSYARSYDGALPVVTAGSGGSPWWRVGKDPKQSNSANLFLLAKTGYVGLDELACAGNPRAPTAIRDDSDRDWRKLEEVSYSYRIMFGPARPGWGMPGSTVVMSDRSPVILRAVAGHPIDPLENSPNHLGSGQHVLRTDGSVSWETSPVLASGDNLWLPRAIEQAIDAVLGQRRLPMIHGIEVPGSVEDAFVGP